MYSERNWIGNFKFWHRAMNDGVTWDLRSYRPVTSAHTLTPVCHATDGFETWGRQAICFFPESQPRLPRWLKRGLRKQSKQSILVHRKSSRYSWIICTRFESRSVVRSLCSEYNRTNPFKGTRCGNYVTFTDWRREKFGHFMQYNATAHTANDSMNALA